MQPEPLTLGDVEAEYRRRHTWWDWAPASERAAFMYSALHQDKANRVLRPNHLGGGRC